MILRPGWIRRGSWPRFLVGVASAVASVVSTAGTSTAAGAYEAYFLHLNDHPGNGAPSWGESGREAQGIAHDQSYWYITNVDRTAELVCPPMKR